MRTVIAVAVLLMFCADVRAQPSTEDTSANAVLLGCKAFAEGRATNDVWIRKWCEQNPTKALVDAASEFVWDQRKDYLEAWFARQAR
jgi:hypothetical protein